MTFTEWLRFCGYKPEPYQREFIDAVEKGYNPTPLDWNHVRKIERDNWHRMISSWRETYDRK